jgi:WD40 repeat protein
MASFFLVFVHDWINNDLLTCCLWVFGGNYRLFSCGTSKDGESYIVEWNESEGAVKRTYVGFRKHSLGVVQFDTTKNRFLAAGDDFSIKFWDMDSVQLLTTIDADGGLPVSSLCTSKL